MGAIEDLTFLGAVVSDPSAVARFIGTMVLTRRQKAALLLDYLKEKGSPLTADVRRAAEEYEEFL